MSKVALRLYIREIETLIDQGHIDEAIAHCQHILKTYPKHLETYRLLGKAYLEAHRYPDSADIFNRVLLAAPDDFVSHLGMSIVCDEQKDLDGAIWHMERAFEISSTNTGVQGELRRLRGRRDGMEPPKIQLTRGALAQIYTKGGEYQQAIAEIKAVLAEDPNRSDMKTLLARAYFRAGMRNEATQACIDLLKEYPYNLDANRILVEILPGTSMAQGVDQYKKRIESLDPYMSFAQGSVFNVESVPDNAVSIERLEYDPNAQPAPTWSMPDVGPTNIPVPQTTPEDQIPDWMKQSGWGESSGEFKEGPVNFDEPEPESSNTGEELAAAEIPDWLKAMAPPGATNEPAPSSAPAEEESSADFDWLAGLGAPMSEKPAQGPVPAPTQPAQPSTPPAGADDQDWLSSLGSTAETGGFAADEGLDWLNNLTPPQEQAPSQPAAVPTPAPSEDSLPDWLNTLDESKPVEPAVSFAPEQPVGEPLVEPPMAESTPEWMMGLSTSETPETSASDESAESIPDWMSGLSASQASDAPAAPSESAPDWLNNLSAPETPAETATPDASESTPDWMSGLSASQTSDAPAAPSESTPDWLSGLTAPEMSETPEPTSTESTPDWMSGLSAPQAPESAAPAESVPDWLKDLSGKETEQPLSDLVSGPGTSQAEQDESLNWLESLAEKQGAKPEELITNPSDRQESVPDWLGQVGETSEPPKAQEPTEYIPEKPVEAASESMEGELSPLVSGPGTTESEQDDAFKWLENLAAGQGAKSEELLTKPEERKERAPGWVGEVDNPPEELSALISGPGTSSSEQDDAMLWLESLAQKQGAKPEELITNPDERKEVAPNWVGQVGQVPDQIVQPQPAEREEPQPVQPPAPKEVETKPLAPVSRKADEDFVPGPLSDLVSGPGTSTSEQDDAMLWLESLAQKQGAKPEELITNPDERKEVAPDWVGQVGQVPDQIVQSEPPKQEEPESVQSQAPKEVETKPLAPVSRKADEDFVPGPLSDLVSGPGTTASEQDDAMLWLESLAQKQGAKPEELITNPEERKEVAPDWVAQVGQESTPIAEEPAAPVETPSTPEMMQSEESLAWLQGFSAEESAEEIPVEQHPAEIPPAEQDWFKDLDEAAAATVTSDAPADEGLDWLDNLDKLEEETPSGLPSQEPEQPVIPPTPEPQAVEPVEPPAPAEVPDWLSSFGKTGTSQQAEPMPWEQETPAGAAYSEPKLDEQPKAAEEEKAPESASITGWLKSLKTEEPTPPASSQQLASEPEELPDWLKDTSDDEQPPTPEPALGWVPSDETLAQPPAEIEIPVSSLPPQVEEPPAKPVAETAPVTPPRPPLRQTGMLGGDKDAMAVQRARDLLGRGGLDAAMNEYTKLIKKGKLLEDVIYDLQEAVYSHPVDVIVWQTLGDAYMRSNRLQEALDAYSKAEELLR